MKAARFARLTIAALLPLACGEPGGDDRGDDTTTIGSATLPPPTSGPGDTSTGGETSISTSNASLDSGSAGNSSDTNPFVFDVGGTPDGGGGGCGGGAETNATLSGTVWAPNGEIPISGAVVYTTAAPPAGIPQQVYCDECQEVNCEDFVTFTNADGTFELDTVAADARYLVVRKGQFMRVTQIDIAEGSAALSAMLTTLPGVNNPGAGLYIPRIAVGYGAYDRIEDALGKFGLADTNIANFEERVIPGTESFHLYDNGRNPSTDGFVSQGNMGQLVADPSRLDDYHIIFVPCSSDGYIGQLNQQNIDNVREWVAAGGRWYVADWANEWLGLTFPEYQNFYDDGFGADLGSYDSLADVLDPGLLDWLTALPNPLKNINPLNDEQHPTLLQLPKVPTVDNWSGIQYPLPELFVQDMQGNDVNVGHKAWLEGPGDGFDIPVNPNHPLTITGQYGCGKIQFTSYHAAEFFNYVGLSPQELVLLYTILEIGVCQEPLPPPAG